MKKFVLIISLLAVLSIEAQERIQSTRLDRSQVHRIYLAPGLGSVLLFPCPILEAFVGRSEDLKAQISPNDKKTLFLNLKLNSSMPTNLIVNCEPNRNVFIFDIIPSKSKHQDLVEIRNFFGRPENRNLKPNSSSMRSSTKKIVVERPRLIQKGGK